MCLCVNGFLLGAADSLYQSAWYWMKSFSLLLQICHTFIFPCLGFMFHPDFIHRKWFCLSSFCFGKWIRCQGNVRDFQRLGPSLVQEGATHTDFATHSLLLLCCKRLFLRASSAPAILRSMCFEFCSASALVSCVCDLLSPPYRASVSQLVLDQN